MDNWTQIHKGAIRHTLTCGVSKVKNPLAVSERGYLEVQAASHALPYMHDDDWNAYLVSRPNADHRIGIIEGLQLVAGRQYPELTARYGKLKKFRNGQVFEGSYPQRSAKSIAHCVEILRQDEDSRQAVAPVYHPSDADHILPTKDIPCTLTFQFLGGGGDNLNMIASMRSSDLYWGFTYDIVQFAMLHCSVARTLERSVDYLYLNLGSQHVYLDQEQAARDYLFQNASLDAKRRAEVDENTEYMYLPYVCPTDSWRIQRETAKNILDVLAYHSHSAPDVIDEFTVSPFLSTAIKELAPWNSRSL